MPLLQLESGARFPVLRLLMRPIAKFCVRHSLLLQECVAALKIELAEAARTELLHSGTKPTASRINLMTGIYREDVPRVLEERDKTTPSSTIDLMLRVLGQWEQDPEFTKAKGGPRVLSYRGLSSEFYALVSKVNRNINPTSVLFALERMGAVAITPRGVRMQKGGATSGLNPAEGFGLIAKDIETLLAVAETNLSGQDPRGHHHIRTEYDNISDLHLLEIREWLLEQGRLFHKRARHYLSKFDRDLNARRAKEGGRRIRAVLQSFSLLDEVHPPATEPPADFR